MTNKAIEDSVATKCAVIVPSYKRADLLLKKAMTLDWVTAQQKYPVFLVLRESDYKSYDKVMANYSVRGLNLRRFAVADKCDDLGKTLDYIMTEAYAVGYEKIVMYDDDLAFSRFDWGEHRSGERIGFEEIGEALDLQFRNLGHNFPYNGLRFRAFSQSVTERIDYNKRIMWTHGVHLPTIVENDRLRFSWEGKVMTDFNFHLSVLAAGHKSHVLNDFTADDVVGPYKDKGGCNTYRTNEVRTRAAKLLQAKFPAAVTTREKHTPEGECLDVTVRFGKAYKQWVKE